MEGLVVGLIVAAFFVWIWTGIFKKAGYSPLMGLLMVVPLVNLCTFIYFA